MNHYTVGNGVPASPVDAARFSRMAAEQGDGDMVSGTTLATAVPLLFRRLSLVVPLACSRLQHSLPPVQR